MCADLFVVCLVCAVIVFAVCVRLVLCVLFVRRVCVCVVLCVGVLLYVLFHYVIFCLLCVVCLFCVLCVRCAVVFA